MRKLVHRELFQHHLCRLEWQIPMSGSLRSGGIYGKSLGDAHSQGSVCKEEAKKARSLSITEKGVSVKGRRNFEGVFSLETNSLQNRRLQNRKVL